MFSVSTEAEGWLAGVITNIGNDSRGGNSPTGGGRTVKVVFKAAGEVSEPAEVVGLTNVVSFCDVILDTAKELEYVYAEWESEKGRRVSLKVWRKEETK